MKKGIKLIWIAFIFITCSFKESAGQDIHFSQFYFTPLSINPAQTGFFNERFRVAGIYRNQWGFMNSPFNTYAFSFDARILSSLAAGVYFYNDRAGDSGYGSSGFMLSSAYRFSFYDNKQSISIGLQGGYLSAGFSNPGALEFGSQIDGSGTGAEDIGNKVNYMDLNAGILYNLIPSSRYNFYTGLAYFHILPPDIDFINDDNPANNLTPRMLLHSGFAAVLTNELDVLPSTMMMFQGGNFEWSLGSAIRYQMNKQYKVRAGMWFRNSRTSDAFTPMVGIDYEGLNVGLSYDINVSSLTEASGGRGGFEIAAVYTFGELPKRVGGGSFIDCPGF